MTTDTEVMPKGQSRTAAGKTDATSSHTPAGERLQSLDILRGFDMFWITGGDELFNALARNFHWAWLALIAGQLDHSDWHGFFLYDLIFPLFLFISGATLPLSVGRRIARGDGRPRVMLRLLRRALLLVVLGVFYNAGHISFDFHNMRFGSVLGHIGLAGCGAGIIVMFARPRAQIFWVLGILVTYWALLTFVPVPGQPVHSYERGKNLTDYLDQQYLPGTMYEKIHDPEGLLSTIPAVATALLGALAGAWLLTSANAAKKTLGLLAAGLVLLGLGWAWDPWFPVIKKIWTSSFVLVTAGWSCLLLGTFYGIVDGLRLRRWGFLFMLIGMNPLTLYVLRGTKLIDFNAINRFFFGFAYQHASRPMRPIWQDLGMMLVQFLFLFWLWRRKIFLRL